MRGTPPSFDYSSNIWQAVHTTKLLITPSTPTYSPSLPLTSSCSPHHAIPDYLNLRSSLNVTAKNMPVKQNTNLWVTHTTPVCQRPPNKGIKNANINNAVLCIFIASWSQIQVTLLLLMREKHKKKHKRHRMYIKYYQNIMLRAYLNPLL